MTTFSISDAAVEGFRVIGRRWRVILGWAAFNLLALVGLFVVLAVVVAGVSLASPSGEAASAVAGIVIGLGSLFIQVMLVVGLFRLMLRPEAPGFLHLRIGPDELRVFAAILVVLLAAVPLVLVVGLAMALAARVSGWLTVLAGVVLIPAAYLVLLRLALAPVIAFAEARIDLVGAWRRTRGQTWRLFGMAVLLVCLIAMMAVVAWLAVFLVGGLLTGFGGLNLSDAENVAEHPGRALLQLLAELMLTPFFLVIGQAPWVAAYRALSEEP